MKIMSSPMLSNNGNNIALYAVFQASSACPHYSRRQICGSIFYPMLRNFWKRIAVWKIRRLGPFIFLVRATCRWSIYDNMHRRKQKYSEKNLSHCHFVQHQTHMESCGNWVRPSRWQASDWPPKASIRASRDPLRTSRRVCNH